MVEMPVAPYSAALTLGAVSGMRSMMAPAVISWSARRSGLDLESTPFSAFKGPGIGRTIVAMAVGELLADKAPFVPNRTDSSTAILARAVSGGAAGAAVFKARRRSMLVGALVGAAAAVGAAYGTYYLRRSASRYFNVSDRVVALVEDGIALTAGLVAISITKSATEPQPEESVT